MIIWFFPANKQWYDLPVDISHEGFGCRVYSIHASFREQGTGLCRLTRATAIWLNYMDQRIESPEKHWWGWSGNIRLRWLQQEKKLHSANTYQQAASIRRTALSDCGDVQRIRRTNHQEHGNYG